MNHLALETSPYLRQHTHNPVDWYPWGPTALERAKREDKPILLSVGYSACHWCHVMAHESFEDAAVAAVMNAHFINVKVDREERPDLDQLYQGVVQLMGRGGGWPLTVFLMPDLRPFYGGTYFPPEPRHGLPGFKALLSAIANAWASERSDLEHQAQAFAQGLGEFTTLGLSAAPKHLTTADLAQAGQTLASHLDPTWGGFGLGGPKFPNPSALSFVLRAWRRSGEKALLDGALLTLRSMATGGMFDQLGGGFHRYSVDERWLVPHFEKMLYDTSLLLHVYSEAHLIAPEPLWQSVVERSVDYLSAEMTSAEGGFFAAQDADSEGEEGRFFVWTPEQMREVLPPNEAELALAHFGVTAQGNFEGASILTERRPATAAQASTLERIRRTLFQARKARVPPGVDDKQLAGWNGLAIRGLARAARVFHRPEWAQRATRAADFVTTRLKTPEGKLARSFQAGQARGAAVLEDYGDLVAGLVALFQCTFEPRHLEAAEALADQAFELFWDPARTAFLCAERATSDVVVPTFALHDNAFPSGASTLCEGLVALTALTGRTRHLERASTYVEKLASGMVENPMAFAHLWCAADSLLDGAATLTLLGAPPQVAAHRRVVEARWYPTLAVLAHAQGSTNAPVLEQHLASRSSAGHGAFLCQHFACQRPVTSDAELEALLNPFTR
jgi:uncharacterized protein